MMIPYAYLIGWTKYNKWYYGSQYGKKANPSNLWTTYFTSSKEVEAFCKEYGEPDVIEVRRTFDTLNECREWESKVIRRMKAVSKDNWFNKSDGHKNFYVKPGLTKRREYTKMKQSQKTKEYWNSVEGQAKKQRLIEKNSKKSEVKGKVWINNGESHKMVFPDMIPDGWKKGKLSVIWVTDGNTNKRVAPDKMPDGFQKGRSKVFWFKPNQNANRDKKTGRFL